MGLHLAKARAQVERRKQTYSAVISLPLSKTEITHLIESGVFVLEGIVLRSCSFKVF